MEFDDLTRQLQEYGTGIVKCGEDILKMDIPKVDDITKTIEDTSQFLEGLNKIRDEFEKLTRR